MLSKYATHDNSAYPQLWRGCVGAWCPSLGPSGSRLFDYSRQQNWATLTNMDPATDWVVDGGAYALDFDGSNDQAIAGPSLVGKSTSMSASLFANLANISDGGALLKIGNDLSDGWGIGRGASTFDSTGNSAIGIYEGVAWISLSYTFSVDTWIHIAVVIDSSGAMNLHINGVRVGGGGSSMRAIGSQGSAVVNIGGYTSPFSSGFPRYCAAKIDDVRLYDRQLSSPEIRTLARRRGIAFTPRTRRLAPSEQAAGGATPWLYARRQSRILGGGVS